MALHTSIIDGEYSALSGVGGVEVSDVETLATFCAEGFEGLLPLCVGGPVAWLVSRG